ncbi:MAG: hypothetical protein ACLGH0_08415, partial [Thermoanaerobaculia bacterium]
MQRADDIVVATGVTSLAERTDAGGIVTRYTLRIEEVLTGKRSPGQHLVLTELGGAVDGRSLAVPGSPRYAPGERYLVFTEDASTYGMSLGRFVLKDDLALREEINGFDPNLDTHVERPRDAQRFLAYIRGLVAQKMDPAPTYFVGSSGSSAFPCSSDIARGTRGTEEPRGTDLGPTRNSYLFEGSFRWQTPSATFVLSGSPGNALDINAAANRGVAEWNATDSSIHYVLTGRNDSATGGLTAADGRNAILFGDPHDEIPASVVARGGAWGAEEYTFGGETFVSILEADVVFNHPWEQSQACTNTVMTHELGHTLGIRHSNRSGDEGPCPATFDCASDAIMRAAVICELDGHLRPWDERAASVVYGAGPPPPCTEAALTSATASRTTIRAGEAVTLTMTATGTAPLTLQWYAG